MQSAGRLQHVDRRFAELGFSVMQFDHLATYSDTTRPGITRLVFTERDMEAREYIKGLMKEAGLTVREDIMGNTFGHWKGSDPTAGIQSPLQHSRYTVSVATRHVCMESMHP